MSNAHDPRSLLRDVDAAFATTGRELEPWPDPHDPWSSPAEDEYSRVTRPERMRILSARADAWAVALVERGLVDLEPNALVEWDARPGTIITRTDRLMPRIPDALTLVLARSQIAGVPDAGLTIGVGEPAALVKAIPACGCDACDCGSDELLNELDEVMIVLLSGPCDYLGRDSR